MPLQLPDPYEELNPPKPWHSPYAPTPGAQIIAGTSGGSAVGAASPITNAPMPVAQAGAAISDIYGGSPYVPPAAAPAPAPDAGPGPTGDVGGGPAAATPPPGYPGGYLPPGYAPDPSVMAQQATQNAYAREAARNAIIAFGDPALAGMAGFGFDPQDAAFARQNYLSGNATLARLDKAHDLARRGIINRLASHGILNSGDLGYLEGEEGRSYGNQTYDARLSLLNYLSQLFQGSAQNSNDLRKKLLTDYMNNAPAAS